MRLFISLVQTFFFVANCSKINDSCATKIESVFKSHQYSVTIDRLNVADRLFNDLPRTWWGTQSLHYCDAFLGELPEPHLVDDLCLLLLLGLSFFAYVYLSLLDVDHNDYSRNKSQIIYMQTNCQDKTLFIINSNNPINDLSYHGKSIYYTHFYTNDEFMQSKYILMERRSFSVSKNIINHRPPLSGMREPHWC